MAKVFNMAGGPDVTGKQDKITASGLLKGNGAGGVSTADAAALRTLINSLSAIAPDVADKIPLADVSGSSAGYSTIENILSLASGGAKIATGSYVGTGTYGQANPCSLTFDFPPALVMLYKKADRWMMGLVSNYGVYDFGFLLLARGLSGKFICRKYESISSEMRHMGAIADFNGCSVSWRGVYEYYFGGPTTYEDCNSTEQFNNTNAEYGWIAWG